MRVGLWVASVACVLVVGCQTGSKKLLSQREIVDDVEGKTSMVDAKIEKYLKLVEEFPTEPVYRERLAGFYWFREDHEKALEQLQAASKLDPDNPKYRHLMGRVYQGIGSYQLAEASFHKVIAMTKDDEFTGPHYDLAWIYMETNRIDEARHEFERCLEIDPYDPLPHYHLAKIAMQDHDRDKAIAEFEKYMQGGGRRFHNEVYQTLRQLQPELGRVRYRPND